MTLNFVILFLASGTTAVAGNLLLKSGMNRLGDFGFNVNGLIPVLIKILSNWQLVVGFALYGFSSILYLKLITAGEVTRIYPAVVSYMFILLLLLGPLFLKESFTLSKVLGIVIIIMGIFLASR